MKQLNLLWGAAAAVLLTGCIDNKYDLSDIDTTSEFKVKDLVIPVNLDPVYLSDIIKVEEGDKLKEYTIGDHTFYAVEQSGTFSSDGIDIDAFEADPEPMTDKVAIFQPQGMARGKKQAGGTGVELYYLVEPVREDMEYEAFGIDGSVKDLTAINFKDLSFRIEIATTSLPDNSDWESALQNVEMFIPKGLTVTQVKAGGDAYYPDVYDPESGKLTLAEVPLVNNKATIEIIAVAIDLSSYDAPFRYDEEAGEGSFILISNFNIEQGTLHLSGPADQISGISEIRYLVHYELAPLNATSIMGSIAYDLSGTGLEIEPIDLEDLPDFLDDPETNLVINNPQIYLQLQNPVGKYGLYYQSSLDITAMRDNEGPKSFQSPMVKVPATTGTYNYVLAPNPQTIQEIPADYLPISAGDRLEYPNLGNILAGNGLPAKLEIDVVEPRIPEQKVTSPFELDQSIEGMEGSYLFLAPLSLKDGSTIVKTVDGWWSEDLADLYIDYLTIRANATNGLTTGVLLNLFAIDRDGNKISTEGSVKLDENAADTPIEIVVAGFDGKPFNNLDGIKIYVVASDNSEQPLEPSQFIVLDDIKAQVTGNYIHKF